MPVRPTHLDNITARIIVGQGPTVLTEDAGGNALDIFSFVHHFSFLSPFLWETV